MAPKETEILTTAEAVELCLHEAPADLAKIERAGFIKKDGADRWPLVPLVQGHARFWQWRATVATQIELAAAWGVSRQRVGQLATEGWIKPLDGHRHFFNWADATGGYIRFLRDEGRRTSKGAAESRVRDARAQEIELRVGLRSGDLMKHSEHVEILDEVVGLFRSELAGLPARLSRDLQERGRIEQVIYDILERIAARAAEAARDIASPRGGDAQADAGDNAGSMGG